MMTWTAYVRQDGDDLILPLPDAAIEAVGWKVGDVLVWELRLDGNVVLTKKIRWYQRIIRYMKEIRWRK